MAEWTDAAGDAWGDYYDSEMDRWEETKSDPFGTFVDGLYFGATGPAPSIGPDWSIDYGPGFIGTINEGATETLYGEDEIPQDLGDDSLLPWWAPYALGGVALLAVLAVLSPYAEIGAGVLG